MTEGSAESAAGTVKLAEGSAESAAGTVKLTEGSAKSVAVSMMLRAGCAALAPGTAMLRAGSAESAAGTVKLTEGSAGSHAGWRREDLPAISCVRQMDNHSWPPLSEFQRGWKRTLPQEIAREACWFPRERTLPDFFEDVPEGSVAWLGFSNSAFLQLSLNWIAHIYRLRKERQLVIAALDTKYAARLLEEGEASLQEQSKRSAMPALHQLHSPARSLHPSASCASRAQVLRAGRHVLLSDVDVVWLTDPEPILRTMWLADVMSSTDCLSVAPPHEH
ncbi:MAG: hypothetical protein SGPRY_012589 [Prymnesium sp.]